MDTASKKQQHEFGNQETVGADIEEEAAELNSSSPEPQQQQQQQQYKIADYGCVNKKKKDRENSKEAIHRSDLKKGSAEIVHDWCEKDELVTVTLFVGPGHDNRSVSVNCLPHKLTVSLNDGRKWDRKLFEKVVPDGMSTSFKGQKVIIKLLKNDPNIEWPSLEPVKKTGPVQQEKEKENVTNGPSAKQAEMSCSDVVTVNNIKTDFSERDVECIIIVYLFVKSLNKNTSVVKFTEDSITARFSTSDEKFLQLYPDTTPDTVFEWHSSLKDKIILEESKFKVCQNSIEIRMKKRSPKKWGSISNLGATTKIQKNLWLPANKVEARPPPVIPAPPPIPPENKKPTCLVSPVSKVSRAGPSSGEMLVSKGLTGLDNIGNTCFMNSVLQCLANTRELREYFLNYNFQKDINMDNPLGMNGKLAVTFALLMKVLWSGTMRSYAPSKLKSIMSIKANQFSGFAQHDSQEFMVELLDGLHEDLNRIKKKPYIAEPPDLDGWSDEDAAEESWRLHKTRNDSIIDDIFKGQFKSTLTCHECQKVSVKFDEFCCLSVPIPKDQKVVQVIFFRKDPFQKPKKHFIRLCADAPVEDLKQELQQRTGVDASTIQIFEVFKSKVHKFFMKSSRLSSVVPHDALMAFEVYSEAQVGEKVVELAVVQRMMVPSPPTRCSCCHRSAEQNSKLRRCTKCYRAGYCDRTCQTNHWQTHKANCRLLPEPVGCPFILSLPESHATYSCITRLMEAYALYSVDIFQPPVSTGETHSRSSMFSGDMSGDENEYMEVESNGSDDLSADSCLDNDSQTEKNEESQACALENDIDADQLSTSPCVRAVQGMPRNSQLSSNQQLFLLCPVDNRAQNLPHPAGEYLEDKGDEPLDLSGKYFIAMDWRTNERSTVHCLVQNKEVECESEGPCNPQRNQTTTLEACIDLFSQPENLSEDDCWRCPRCQKAVEATKQMSVWRLPTILIVQLKRFSFKYVLYSDKIDKFIEYPVRGLNLLPYMCHKPQDGPAVYDLYGVINHMGRLLGGHYTAYARTVQANSSQQSELDWRYFDDSRASYVPESRVVNDQAYLLFYRRRDKLFIIERPLEIESEPIEESLSTPTSLTNPLPPQEALVQDSTDMLPISTCIAYSEPVSTAQEELD